MFGHKTGYGAGRGFGYRRGAPSEAVPNSLTWAPPEGWESYTLKTLVEGGNSFDNDTNYRAVIPNGHLTIATQLKINGGGNIVFVQPDGSGGYKLGGRITITGTTTEDAAAIQIAPHWDTGQPPIPDGRIVHIEGVLFDGAGLNDVIAGGEPNTIIQFQNCHVVETHGSFETAHADIIQPWNASKEIRVDGITATSGYQGLFLRTQFLGDPGPIYLRRINIRSKIGTKYMFWVVPDSTETRRVQIDNGTVKIQPGDNAFNQSVWPDVNATGTNTPTFTGTTPNQKVTWPNAVNAITGDGGQLVLAWDGASDGEIHEFDPATDQDYVAAASVGENYVSPGYGATPPTPWEP